MGIVSRLAEQKGFDPLAPRPPPRARARGRPARRARQRRRAPSGDRRGHGVQVHPYTSEAFLAALERARRIRRDPSGLAWSPTAWRRTSRGTGPRRSTTASTRRWSASAPGSVPCPARSPGSPRSLPELLQQRLRLAQIARVEALGEPAVDRSEQVARLHRAALGLEPAAKARRRAHP